MFILKIIIIGLMLQLQRPQSQMACEEMPIVKTLRPKEKPRRR